MIFRPCIHFVADAHTVAATLSPASPSGGAGDSEIQQRVAAIKTVVRSQPGSLVVKERQHGAGFGADAFGGEVQNDGIAGFGFEFDFVGVASWIQRAPETYRG